MFVAKRELNSRNSYDIMKSDGGVTSTAAANKSAARARGLTCSKTYFTRAILLCQPSCCNTGKGVIILAKNSKNEKRKEYDKKYEQSRSGQRTRNWTAVCYPDDLPDGWESLIEGVKWVCSPLHDKDLSADGTPKKSHYHILLMFSAVKTAAQVVDFLSSRFGTSEDSGSIIGVAAPQRVSDRTALVRYMAHMDNPEKAQYSVDEIRTFGGADVLELLQHNKREIAEMMMSIEQFIDDNGITELCDLSAALRQTDIDLYLLVATQHTYYFNAYIRSRRHKALLDDVAAAEEVARCRRLAIVDPAEED